MSHTTEPEVVFCEFNHIYDKSLNDKCPYCKQIMEQTNRMKRQVGGTAQKSGGKFWDFLRHNRSSDPDATVLKGAGAADDDDATVLSRSVADDDDATVLAGAEDDDATVLGTNAADDDDVTQLQFSAAADSGDQSGRKAATAPTEIRGPETLFGSDMTGADTISAPIPERRISIGIRKPKETEQVGRKTLASVPVRPEDAVRISRTEPAAKRVIGWLVCTKGEPNYGSSKELKEGVNGLSFDADGTLRILEGEETCQVVISRDQETGIFRIRDQAAAGVSVNDRRIDGVACLEPYSKIQFPDCSFVFFPAVGVCGFEWRQ